MKRMGEVGGLFPDEVIQQLVTKVLLKLGELYSFEAHSPAHPLQETRMF